MGFFDFFRKKKPTKVPAPRPSPTEAQVGTRHCFVLCRSEKPDDLSRASAVAADVFGYGYTAESKDSVVSVMFGEKMIGFLGHMPFPIPDGEAEANAAGNLLWPNGEEEAALHRSHVIVYVTAGDEESPVEVAMTVTRLALIALELFDGLGVYWGNASVTNSRELFEQCAGEMTDTHLPLQIWLRFQPVKQDDEFGMYTLGLRQFGLMEIEIERCPLELSEVFDFVSNLAHYLVMSGPVIKDGNTVGGSAEERILVRHQPSMIEKTRRVHKVIFE